ncbi:MarR family winged helix-turn-helix transcriptional regulator [Roseateles koreensis]|uniref:MarR family transcriptional regulator n=1 Tax=Roseateles koreensis TaxID=2987526 RepID=A0ABT5KWK8_9BURK|nr:MarR family transcriptional regulator [Roseateles koreensis]MDC8787186.1 MarR family transcriptional regulator [Roseateles koreensis]
MASPPRLIFLLNSAQRRLQQWMASLQGDLSGQGSAPTPAHSGVLFMLDKNDGATMGELALGLDLGPSAMSGLIQRMEALGWVRRQPCPLDARTQRVWLQGDGRQQLPALYEALKRINQSLKSGFTDEELQTVARWLRHVQHIQNAPHGDSTP